MSDEDKNQTGKAVVTVGNRTVTGAAATLLARAGRTAASIAPNQMASVMIGTDATLSREPNWNATQQILARLLRRFDRGFELNLAYYRGRDMRREYRAFGWTENSQQLVEKMQAVQCLVGETQVGPFLADLLQQARQRKISGAIFNGDCYEEIAAHPRILEDAKELGRMGVKVHFLQEGTDVNAAHYFKELADATGGTHTTYAPGDHTVLDGYIQVTAASLSGQRAHIQAIDYKGLPEPVRRLAYQLKLTGPDGGVN